MCSPLDSEGEGPSTDSLCLEADPTKSWRRARSGCRVQRAGSLRPEIRHADQRIMARIGFHMVCWRDRPGLPLSYLSRERRRGGGVGGMCNIGYTRTFSHHYRVQSPPPSGSPESSPRPNPLIGQGSRLPEYEQKPRDISTLDSFPKAIPPQRYTSLCLLSGVQPAPSARWRSSIPSFARTTAVLDGRCLDPLGH